LSRGEEETLRKTSGGSLGAGQLHKTPERGKEERDTLVTERRGRASRMGEKGLKG